MAHAPANAMTLRRPRGLAARAAVFATGLLAVTAILSAATILLAAKHESRRHQIDVTSDLTARLARIAGALLGEGDVAALRAVVERAMSDNEVRGVSLRDQRGRVILDAGASREDAAIADRLAARVLSSGEPAQAQSADGAFALGAPIMRDANAIGVAVMVWEPHAYRFDAARALAPALLLVILFAVIAIPLTGAVVRRAVAPLRELVSFTERIAEQGSAPPLKIRTGDEFETLANAFNHMISRLDATVRQVQEIAFVDPASGLPNYDRFAREVDFCLMRARGDKDAGAVAVLELARLPRFMQTLGPDAVRDLLRAIAERLAASVRQSEGRRSAGAEALTARIGVAEFAVWAPGRVTPAEAARFAQQLNAAMGEPLDWRGHKLTLGARCGVAIAPRDGREADAVIRHARMALAAAPQGGGSPVRVFTQSLDREAMARIMLEREMRGALERNEFRAYFQPKIALDGGRIDGCEALARWVRPDRTIISPGRFIPVAEESGLIGALSEAIMREACWKAAAWARAGHPAKVAVNVSALQFRERRFAENVLRVVEHAGLPPDHLELEITESVVMEDPDRALPVVRTLRDAGVRLAIDDFGCGHSSLAALSKLPFDVIKIDQQFVRALERGDAQAAAIIEMILALARTLHMDVVAEGVERREEREFLAERGCRWIQGFLCGAAVSAPEFAEMLRQQDKGEMETSAA